MKKLLLTLLCLSSTYVRADLVVEQKLEGGTTAGSILIRVKGDWARMDMPASRFGEVSVIVDLKEGQITTLNHDKKSFVRGPLEATKKAAEAQLKEAGVDLSKDVVPKATGQKEKVGEWETEIFEGIVAGNKTKYWVVKDFPNYKPLNAQMSKFIMGAGAFDPNKNDLGGMIVKSETIQPKDSKVTKTVVKLEEKAVEDSVFKTPEGYEAVEVPKQ